MWDDREEARWARSVWGDTIQLFGVANWTTTINNNIKNIVAFSSRWLIISHTTINQKQTPATGASMERMCDWVVGAGEVQ
jgi:hypothetical protein